MAILAAELGTGESQNGVRENYGNEEKPANYEECADHPKGVGSREGKKRGVVIIGTH